ncbi:MAG TPA: MtnX-like HAD-IB family phosphatase [Symbiobacteriaceae bacterium]
MNTERLQPFWASVKDAPVVVLTDFDNTVTQEDVGFLILRRLAPPSPETLRRFAAREIGSRAVWLESMARVDREEGEAIARSVPLDPHFPGFVRWCRQNGIPLAVVSDGFGYYIRCILQREGLADLPVFCNDMPRSGVLTFPHGNPACDRCGCCKALVVKRVREAGARVIYVGDGYSDLYAAGFADWVFAKGTLAAHMRKEGSPFYPMESYADVHRVLAEHLERFRAGTAPGRSTLSPDPLCRF